MTEKINHPVFYTDENTHIDGITFKYLPASGFDNEDKVFLCKLYGTTRWDEVMQAPWTDEQRHEFLNTQFEAQYQHYLSHYPKADYMIMLKNNERIGRLYVDHDDVSICLIDIAILPQYKYRGIGSTILRHLLSDAQAAAKKVVIHVENFNPAYQWYMKHGFKQVEDKGVYQYMEWYPQ